MLRHAIDRCSDGPFLHQRLHYYYIRAGLSKADLDNGREILSQLVRD